jgi:hypothetical protein
MKPLKILRLGIGLPVFCIGWIIFAVGALIAVTGFEISGVEDK